MNPRPPNPAARGTVMRHAAITGWGMAVPERVLSNADPAWNNKVYQAGQVAFVSNPSNIYTFLSGDDPELMARTGLFGLPAGPAGALNQIETWSLGLFRQSPYPNLAKGFAEYVMQHGVREIYVTLPLGSQPRIQALLEQVQGTTASIFFAPDVFVPSLAVNVKASAPEEPAAGV